MAQHLLERASKSRPSNATCISGTSSVRPRDATGLTELKALAKQILTSGRDFLDWRQRSGYMRRASDVLLLQTQILARHPEDTMALHFHALRHATLRPGWCRLMLLAATSPATRGRRCGKGCGGRFRSVSTANRRLESCRPSALSPGLAADLDRKRSHDGSSSHGFKSGTRVSL